MDEAAELRRLWEQDPAAVGEHLEEYRARLRRMLEIRMDPMLRARIDASDIIQETFVDVVQRVPEYLAEPRAPFYLWIRSLAGKKLLHWHRHHLGTGKRDAHREARPAVGGMPTASTLSLAGGLVDPSLSPSRGAVRAEQTSRLQEALEELPEVDRELLTLRHFEQLSNVEAASIVGLSEANASARYLRAMSKLGRILSSLQTREE